MIEEQVQVIDIEGDELVLQAQVQSACGQCAAKKGCGTAVLSKVVGQKFTRFTAPNAIDAHIGDTVVVGIAEDALLTGSLVMYVVPLLGMLVSALLADFWLLADPQKDLNIAISGIVGLVAGSYIAKRYFRSRTRQRQFTPVVLRKVIDCGNM